MSIISCVLVFLSIRIYVFTILFNFFLEFYTTVSYAITDSIIVVIIVH